MLVGAANVLTPPPAPVFNAAMFNISDNFEADDPGFESPDARTTLDFQLRNDSAVYKTTAFVRIPIECFGPGKRCPGEEADWGAHARALLSGRG